MYPHDAATAIARYCAPRLDEGYEVEALRRRLAQRAGHRSEDKAPRLVSCAACRSDHAARRRRLGAERRASRGAGVSRHLCGRSADRSVLANGYREDLKKARLGSGHHGFEFKPPDGSAFAPEGVEVRRSLDGRVLFRRRRGEHCQSPSTPLAYERDPSTRAAPTLYPKRQLNTNAVWLLTR